MNNLVLLANNYIHVPAAASTPAADVLAARVELGTLVANLAYFGFAPSLDVMKALQAMSVSELASFWQGVEPSFKSLTGDDRNMGDFVVYKNFPREVLKKSQAEYWLSQILMYMGAPNEWFTELPEKRPALDDRLKLKVLTLATPDTLSGIYASLVATKVRWTDAQQGHAVHLVRELKVGQAVGTSLDLAAFGFKENGIVLMATSMGAVREMAIADATDVLRLAAAMSDAADGLRGTVKFRSFSRPERRQLLSMLEHSKNLLDDMGLHPTLWKKLLSKLHPGDFKFPKVIAAYNDLYSGEYETFNASVESKLFARDQSVLEQLASRPGDFARRLHSLWALFGMAAVNAFVPVATQLNTTQLLKLRSYLTTVNSRLFLIYPPKGNWGKAQFVPNEKTPFSDEALTTLREAIDEPLAKRLAQAFPQGVNVAAETEDIKLQTNDQELAPHGRGTSFPIPAEMTFIRTASFWKQKSAGSTWFDNGVSFFDESWTPMSSCCWNKTSSHHWDGAAVFSGDPTNSKDLEGRGCQMIDLYLDKLQAKGIRYAVWNILCFSGIPFADAPEVLATLQWGEKPESGKLFEPARAQMVFPLKGTGKTKFIAYIDVVARRLVYMDANFAGATNSAVANEKKLAERMPAFVEYLNSLPSVATLFANAPAGNTPVLYSDANHTLPPGEKAYVFKPENPENSFEAVKLTELL